MSHSPDTFTIASGTRTIKVKPHDARSDLILVRMETFDDEHIQAGITHDLAAELVNALLAHLGVNATLEPKEPT